MIASLKISNKANIMARKIGERDFLVKVIKELKTKGITIVAITSIPGNVDMPFANSQRGYIVNDNGCNRIWSYSQVCNALKV